MFLGFGINVLKFQYLLKPPLTLSPCSSCLSPWEPWALPGLDPLNADLCSQLHMQPIPESLSRFYSAFTQSKLPLRGSK